MESAGVRQARELLDRWTPSQGWPTLALLLITLGVTVYPVVEADWTETPGLLNVLVWSTVAGLLLAKVRAPAALLHLVALGLGLVVVVWQVSALIENEPPVDQVRILWDRLDAWYDAARSGGINTDLIPFSVGIVASAWLLGYISSWFVFRSNNVWVTIVLCGAATISNLSFLATRFESRFFLFVFFAMLLVVRMNVVQRHEGWRKSGTAFTALSGWRTVHAAVWFSVLVVLISALLPLAIAGTNPLTNIWKLGRSPMENMSDEFARMFAGLPSRKDFDGRFFGKTMPFLGKVSLGDDVALWARSEFPSYWLAQTYSEYTPQGWIAGDTRSLDIGPNVLPPEQGDSLKREPVPQALRLGFGTSDLLAGGALTTVNRDAVMEVLQPKRFEIDLLDPSDDALLPDDVQAVARRLRERLNPPPSDGLVESFISQVISRDLVVVDVDPGSGSSDRSVIKKVTLERKEPVTPEIASWQLKDSIREDQTYSMVSLVSVATNADLRLAGPRYSGFITDHYLQLPRSLPERVRRLGEALTRGAQTPLDKALAVQNYLRGPDFTYSQDIKRPPRNADGVDYFLFESKEGYSAYFASAMTVLLRTAGVPARLAAGYAPGEHNPESGVITVRDSDSHGWVQVFFPGYGWIDFEPTTTYAPPERGLPGVPEEESAITSTDEIDLSEIDNPDTEEDLPPGPAEEGDVALVPSNLGAILFRSLMIAIGILIVLWLLLALLWNKGLGRLGPVERVYTKMSRLGALAGLGRGIHQTPTEYAAALGKGVPGIEEPARQIAAAFATGRYGRESLDEEASRDSEQAWLRIRIRLAAQALRRLNPLTGGA